MVFAALAVRERQARKNQLSLVSQHPSENPASYDTEKLNHDDLRSEIGDLNLVIIIGATVGARDLLCLRQTRLKANASGANPALGSPADRGTR